MAKIGIIGAQEPSEESWNKDSRAYLRDAGISLEDYKKMTKFNAVSFETQDKSVIACANGIRKSVGELEKGLESARKHPKIEDSEIDAQIEALEGLADSMIELITQKAWQVEAHINKLVSDGKLPAKPSAVTGDEVSVSL